MRASDPRRGLDARFGPEPLRRLRQAFGEIDEPLDPDLPVPAMRARLTFAEPVSTPDDLARIVERLAQELCAKLEAAELGLRRARLIALRADGTAAPPLSVLVVDDDADIGRLVAMYVKQAAPTAEIRIAKNADEALEAFRKKSPRLVFLDLMMPKTNGLELFTYLRGVHLVDASTVVAMSAGGNEDDVQLMLELGAHDFIPKGTELRARVSKIVASLVTDSPPHSTR